jgi:vacuolar-type H+-ATPase subunit H/ElaB/YqjD/DUF883 family membrane-anchored ribosome-binding protein
MGQRTEEQLTTDIAGTREDLAQNLDALNYRVNPSQVMARRKRAARGRLTSMKEKVMGSAHDMRESASSTGSSMTSNVSGTASDAASTLQSKTEGNPLAAGVIAFGAGWLISSLMPASEQEQQAARKVVETAKEHGQPVIDEAKSVGQEMGQNLKEQAGQAADEVKSSAQESAQNVKQEGQSSAETVKRQAPTQS